MQRDVLKRLDGPLGQRGDGPVAVAASIAAQTDEHHIPARGRLPGAGGQPGLVLQLVPRRTLAAACPPGAAGHRGRPAARHVQGPLWRARITAALREAGVRVTENTVAALLRRRRLAAPAEAPPANTTRPARSDRRALDLIGRDFAAEALNCK